MLTAKQFAVETGISYPVIIEWLKDGRIPEAEQTSFKVWQIPADVAEMFKKPENRPKLGRPPKPTDGVGEEQPNAGDQVEASAEEEAPAVKPKKRAAKRSPAKKASKTTRSKKAMKKGARGK